MKELKDAVLFQNHRRNQGMAQGARGPYNRNATNDKSLTKMPCFFIFSFFYNLCVQQYTRTTVISNK